MSLPAPAKFVLFQTTGGDDHGVNAYSVDQVQYKNSTSSKIIFNNKTNVTVVGTVANVMLALAS